VRERASLWLGPLIALLASCAAPVPSGPVLTTLGVPRIALPNPGRPYTSADILRVLRAAPGSRLPGELVRSEVAEALAQAVWTFDGRPYQILAAEGSCGPRGCELSVQGVPDIADEARLDHYIFNVDPTSFALTRVYLGLAAFPPEINPQLDKIVRAGVPPQRLEGLSYVSATWLPPPEFGRFEVTYDDGGLEGSRGLKVLVDTRLGSVILIEDFTR
jgi:hypothetical protein